MAYGDLQNYDSKGEVIIKETGVVVERIDCRAASENVKDASINGEAFAVGGFSFAVATGSKFHFIPFTHGIRIEGAEYKIVRVGHSKDRVIGRGLLKPQYQSIEQILYLE